MVKQGTIIKINFNPQSGHERAGYRPAVVISNDVFNEKTKLSIVCPKTTGVILCEHIKSLDLNSRTFQEVEELPRDLLEKVINIVFAEIEEIK